MYIHYYVLPLPDPGGTGGSCPKMSPNLMFTLIFLTNSVDLLQGLHDSTNINAKNSRALLLDPAARIRPPLRVCPLQAPPLDPALSTSISRVTIYNLINLILYSLEFTIPRCFQYESLPVLRRVRTASTGCCKASGPTR